MKKVVAVLFVLVVASMLFAGYVFDKPTCDLRAESCVVVSCIDNVVTVETADGNLWAFYSDGDLSCGDSLTCIFDGNMIVDAF